MRLALVLCLAGALIATAAGSSRDPFEVALMAQAPAVNGRWVVKADFYGTTRYLTLQLEERAGRLTGTFAGDPLDGTVTGARVHFVSRDGQGGTSEVDGMTDNATITARVVQRSPGDPTSLIFHFTAT